MLQYFPQCCWNFKDINKSYSRSGYKPIHYAIIAKNLLAAKNIIQRGADPRSRTGHDRVEPLHCAVDNYSWMDTDYQLDAVRFLLDCGADPNCVDDNGNLALISAAMTGSKSVLETLLDKGGDIHACDRQGRGLLHYSLNGDIVTVLLKRKIDTNLTDKSGGVALHTASAMGHVDAVEALLSYYEADVPNREKITPMHLAAGRGNLSVVRLLARRLIDVDILDSKGRTPLHFVTALANSEYSDYEVSDPMKELMANVKNYEFGRQHILDDHKGVMTYLLERGSDVHRRDSTGRSSLHWAIEGGNRDLVQMLLDNGSNPIALDEQQQEPINYAFKYMAFSKHLKDITFLLLNRGANPNRLDASRSTPLHHAVQCPQVEVVKMLLEYKANPNMRNAEGKTALHLAIERDNLKIAQILLAYGADPVAIDNTQRVPLDYIVKCKYWCKDFIEVAALLIEKGADPNRLDANGSAPLHRVATWWSIEMVELLLKHKAQIDKKNAQGKTALHLALESSRIGTAQLLLTYGADPMALDHQQVAPIDFIFQQINNEKYVDIAVMMLQNGADPNRLDAKGHAPLDYVYMLLLHRHDKSEFRKKITAMLLEKEANPNRLVVRGSAPLHHELMAGNFDMVELLLKHNALVDVRDKDGKTVLHLALEKGNIKIANTFLTRGADPLVLDNLQRGPLNYIFKFMSNCLNDENAMRNMTVQLLQKGADPNRLDADGSAPLHHAAENGTIELVQILLKHEARVNQTDAAGRTALHLAAGKPTLEIAQLLLNKNSDPLALDQNKQEPLNYLFKSGRWSKYHKEIAALLLKRGADPNRIGAHERTSLHHAALYGHIEGVELLLKHRARVDLKDAEGRTVLHIALRRGDMKVARELLLHGADPVALDKERQEPLNYLSRYGFWRDDEYMDGLIIATMLLEKGANPNRLDSERYAPLHRAATKGIFELAELLLKHHALVGLQNAEKRTALHMAIGDGTLTSHLDIAHLLLNHDADAAALDSDGQQPLNYLFKNKIWSKYHEEIAMLLLEKGADSNWKDIVGRTPLHHVAEEGHLEMVDILLKHNAHIDERDAERETPLHLAIQQCHFKLALKLLDQNADPVALDFEDLEPLYYVFMRNRWPYSEEIKIIENITATLLRMGANPNTQDGKGCTPLHYAAQIGPLRAVELLLEHGACIQKKDATGKTALHLATSCDQLDIAQILLTHGADPVALDNHNQEPIHYIFKCIWRGMNEKEMVEVFLKMGADPNRLDADGCAPLHHAVSRGNLKLVELLLNHKARVDLPDNHQQEPLHYIFKSRWSDINEKEIASLLLENGADPNRLDAYGNAPLHHAVGRGDLELVELLLKYKARVDLPGRYKRTALDLAYNPSTFYYNYPRWSPRINETEKIVATLERAVQRSLDDQYKT